MKCIRDLILASILLSGVASSKMPKSEDEKIVETSIVDSFKSMYSHLAYVSHYIAKITSETTEDDLSPNQASKIMELSNNNCHLLGLVGRNEIPYLKTTLKLDKKYNVTGEETYKNLNKVESDITKALANLEEMCKIWKQYFESETMASDCEEGCEKSQYVYSLLFNDYTFIFYKIAQKISEVYEIESKKADKEEVYAKGIFIEGLMSQNKTEVKGLLRDDMSFIRLTKKIFIPNTQLLERMFNDVEKQIQKHPIQIDTLISVFHKYKKTMGLL